MHPAKPEVSLLFWRIQISLFCIHHTRILLVYYMTINIYFKDLFGKLLCRPYLNTFYIWQRSSTSYLDLLNMSKPEIPSHIKYRDRQRETKGRDPPPSLVGVKVLGTGALHHPANCIIETNYVRYLFNCGEGTQRLATEHKLKMVRCEHVFITHKSWKNVGGLLGFVLTMDDLHRGHSNQVLTLHGPPNFENMLEIKGYGSRNHRVVKREIPEGIFSDATMTVEYIPIYKSVESANTLEEDSNASKKIKLETDDVSVAFLCKPHQPKRKIDLDKVINLDIPKLEFRKFGNITDGQEITLEDGRAIKPDQVLKDIDPVLPILVIECPDENFLDPLLTNERLRQQQEDTDCRLDLVVHMSPQHIMCTDQYQDWMKRFNPDTKHLVLNEGNSDPNMMKVYEMQAVLNLLHDRIFPLLPGQIDLQQPEVESDNDTRIIKASTNLKYQVIPKYGYNRNCCFTLDNAAYIKEMEELDGFEESLEELKSTIQSAKSTETREYPRIIFLGTGSAQPSLIRNVSSTLVQMSEKEYMLLDCGEDTIGQLHRFYGNKLDDVLLNLKGVFISHLHPDHYLGLFGILFARIRAFSNINQEAMPLLVLAPHVIKYWFQSYSTSIENIQHLIRHVMLSHLEEPDEFLSTNILSLLNLKEFTPVPVRHCNHAFGLVIQHQAGWKLTFSGDTMPCHALVEAGYDSDILIHEASMEDDLEKEAKRKNHSTTSQAIEVGVKMRAKFILLNHFSQRYPKIPVLNDNFSERVGISFDNMQVSPSDFHLLPHFVPTLKIMFANSYHMMECRVDRRKIRQLRELEKEEYASSTAS